MLCSLRLRNIATISDTSLDLAPGLNVLTGETGAGKSILVDGLLLALGDRADHSIVRPGERIASVEALFQTEDGELLVRREVFSSGRSRILIDDELTDLETTRERIGALVDLHTQRSTPALLSRRTQQTFLDSQAGCLEASTSLRSLHRRIGQIDQRMSEIEASLGAASTKRELLEFESTLLSDLKPSRDEFLGLAERRRDLEKDIKLAGSLSALSDLLSADSTGFLHAVRERRAELEGSGTLEEAVELLREAEIALDEASRLCASRLGPSDGGQWDAGRIDARLDEYGRLLGRYGGDIDRLLSRIEEIGGELAAMHSLEEENSALGIERQRALVELASLAAGLSSSRISARDGFCEGVLKELRLLGMEGASFEILLGAPPRDRCIEAGGLRICPDGAEVPEFAFSANPGLPPGPLQAVPSGGELSRLSLSIKLAMSSGGGATMVFDEIDSGVGGTVAHLLADSLSRAAGRRQLVVITHLPQIAARAGRHLSVDKDVSDGLAETRVRLRKGEDRVSEIARMLGGGGAAMDHARSMLEGAPS